MSARRFHYALTLEGGRELTRAELAAILRDVANSWEASGEPDIPAAGEGPVFGLHGITGAYRARFGDEPPVEDDPRPLPFVGDLLRIRYVGGEWMPAGEVTQVTGSVVTLEHTHDFDLQLAEDWEVVPRPAAYGPGPYGWNPSQEHIERVEAELARQREQAARRRAERSW